MAHQTSLAKIGQNGDVSAAAAGAPFTAARGTDSISFMVTADQVVVKVGVAGFAGVGRRLDGAHRARVFQLRSIVRLQVQGLPRLCAKNEGSEQSMSQENDSRTRLHKSK